MKINRNSWHARIVNFLSREGEFEHITVCGYWGKLVSSPFFCVFVVVLFTALSPFLLCEWLGDKYPKLKRKVMPRMACPFGRVEFMDAAPSSAGESVVSRFGEGNSP